MSLHLLLCNKAYSCEKLVHFSSLFLLVKQNCQIAHIRRLAKSENAFTYSSFSIYLSHWVQPVGKTFLFSIKNHIPTDYTNPKPAFDISISLQLVAFVNSFKPELKNCKLVKSYQWPPELHLNSGPHSILQLPHEGNHSPCDHDRKKYGNCKGSQETTLWENYHV